MKNSDDTSANQNTLSIGGKKIGRGQPVFLIAEAGVNHNGCLETALDMIQTAAHCGVDAVKFQTFKAERMIMDGVEKAPYQKANTGADDSQSQMLRQLEIDREFHLALMRQCEKCGVLFMSTPYDTESLDMLVGLGVGAVKVSSTDADNYLFLKKIAQSGLPVVFSTGMCSMDEVEKAVCVLEQNGCGQIGVLKCTTDYPADENAVNLTGIGTLAHAFPRLAVGFSDHTPGVDVSVYSVFCGASIVEKHFTLDKTQPGPDHKASLDPSELKLWVEQIRRAERIKGPGGIEPAGCELEARKTLRRSLVALRDIEAGCVVCEDDLTAKRAGGKGIGAHRVFDVLGTKTARKIYAGELVCERMLELKV